MVKNLKYCLNLFAIIKKVIKWKLGHLIIDETTGKKLCTEF